MNLGEPVTERPPPSLLRFAVTMALVAVAGGSISFFEARTPGSPGLWMSLFSLFLISIMLVIGLIRAVWNVRSWTWMSLVLLGISVAAPFAGRSFGFKARDLRFERWRLPIYSRIVDRVKSKVVVPPYDQGAIQIELAGEKRDVAYRADAWTDPAGNLVMRFWWAGTGPPPMHWTYQFYAGGAPTAEELRMRPMRQVKPNWYEVRF
jgi:hypothetical protein